MITSPRKPQGRRLTGAALLLWALGGCAGPSASLVARNGGPLAHDGWRHVLAGDATRGVKAFDDALAKSPEDPFARFGRAAVAFEHGRTELALDDVQALLAAAAEPSASPWARWLATASSGWVSTLIYEAKSWQQRLPFLADQQSRDLPWLARMELLQVADDTARRAGRLDVLSELARHAACPTQAQQTSVAGRRPVLDLLKPVQALPKADARVYLAGCRAQVPAPDGLPGVLVVHTSIKVPAAANYDVALDYRGLAAFRIDGGDWHLHGAADAWGPSRSAAHRKLAAGSHDVEMRLSTYGGGADYWLAAWPSSQLNGEPPAVPAKQPPSVSVPLSAYAQLLVAGQQGHWIAGLKAVESLRPQRSFALGLVQVGRFAEAEPTQPDNVTRDAARSAWRLAVELDPQLVRARLALSAVESMEGRPREATAQAQAARNQAPQWWPAALAAYEAFSAEGFDHHADAALEAGLQLMGLKLGDPKSPEGPAWACPLVDAALRRARQLDQLAVLPSLQQRQLHCDARDPGAAMHALDAGNAAQAVELFAQATKLSSSPQWMAGDHARALVAAGDVPAAVALTESYAQIWPRETAFWLRLANLHTLAGQAPKGREMLVTALKRFPAAADVRQAARAVGVALPIDKERIDGLEVIAKYIKAGRHVDAPAVFVLDRMVERVFGDGTRMVLTHNIVKVQSKEALDRWGEVNVPAGSEVITLRTVKPDLSVREPEDIFGKESVSAPELEVGDFVEWETLETLEASAAFGPGFLGQRFYFQSNEAPMEHSEYVVVYPASMALSYDLRANAPQPVREALDDGLTLLRFKAQNVAQIFPERAAVAPLHWLPSVRIASGVTTQAWTSFVADRLATIARQTPEVEQTAKTVLELAGGNNADAQARARALVSWVTQNIEAEGTLDEPASYALARGRGNRMAVALALSRALGLEAEAVLVRPLTTESVNEPIVPQELMAFSETLLHFPQVRPAGRGPGTFVDLRWRQAPFGYVPSELDGARALRMPAGEPLVSTSLIADRRQVEMRIAVAPDGSATIWAKEKLVGGPAVEWAEALRQLGPDVDKRRRRFEEAYLAYHFPGADLQDVRFDVQAEAVLLEYMLTVERFATPTQTGLVIEPRFFLSQPGRRFSSESQRSTTLLMGPDVPLELTAAIEWPAGYRVAESGEGLAAEPLGPLGPRFVERRTVERSGDDKPARVVIRRDHRVPLMRVGPDRYKTLGAALRRVDVAEQAVIRVIQSSKAPNGT